MVVVMVVMQRNADKSRGQGRGPSCWEHSCGGGCCTVVNRCHHVPNAWWVVPSRWWVVPMVRCVPRGQSPRIGWHEGRVHRNRGSRGVGRPAVHPVRLEVDCWRSGSSRSHRGGMAIGVRTGGENTLHAHQCDEDIVDSFFLFKLFYCLNVGSEKGRKEKSTKSLRVFCFFSLSGSKEKKNTLIAAYLWRFPSSVLTLSHLTLRMPFHSSIAGSYRLHGIAPLLAGITIGATEILVVAWRISSRC